MRLDQDRVCTLVVIGVRADGKKELVALVDGHRESTESWASLLRDARRRGMRAPVLAVGDGALGFWAALAEVFPETRHGRCWQHKVVNVLDCLPKSAQPAARKALAEIRDAEDREHAEKAIKDFAAAYKAKYPKDVAKITDDQEQLLAFYDLPAEHWVHLKTSNPIESTFATVRLRTKVTKGPGSWPRCISMPGPSPRQTPTCRAQDGLACVRAERKIQLRRPDEDDGSTSGYKRSLVIITVLIILVMLMEAVRWLRESGLKVEDHATADQADTGVDAILDVAADDRSTRFAVQVKQRAPYPHEVEQLGRSWRQLAKRGRPLMVAPFVSESLGLILTRADWSWADDQGNFDLRAPGLLLRQRRTTAAPAPRQRSLPRGSGSFAVIRALVAFSDSEDGEPGATALAAQAGVSQPRVSQILRQLHGLKLVKRTGHGRWKPRREALLDRFLAEYPGPGGSEQYCYSLDSPIEVAVRAGQLSAPRRPIVASADVGPDLIVPWRRPSLVILYAKHVIDPSSLGLIDAQGRHDANVIVRMPDDQSVFPVPALVAQVQGNDVPLADPLQQIWDLQHLDGADRLEAAGRLRQWLLARP